MKSSEQYQLTSQLNPTINVSSVPLSIDNTSVVPSQLMYPPVHLQHISTVNQIYPASIIQDTSETDDHINLNDEFEICVHGIPGTGAKSRVETQIKLSIQLTSKDGIKAPYWSYLRIKDSMLARSKLKKSQHQKLLNGSAAAMVSNEFKVLDLEARIVCETDKDKIIKMCHGCVRRERKRAERKKYCKPSSNKVKPDVYDKEFERDRQRVLLFNCEPLVNFSTGEATIPTRITCYCRHHNEKIGFRVRFTVKNYKGVVVATGDTPPIMITDDHKTFKNATLSMETCKPETRHRRAISSDFEEDSDFMATPGSSRRNSFSGSEAESDAGVMSTNTSFVSGYMSAASSPVALNQFSNLSCIDSRNASNLNNNNSSHTSSPQTPSTPNSYQHATSENPYGQFQVPESKVSHSHHYRTTQTMITHPIMLQETEFDEQHALPSTRRHRRLDNVIMSDSMSPNNDFYQQPSKDILYDQSYSTPALSSFVPAYQAQSTVPILNSITPFEGPIYGGVQVTIEGEGFHSGLTLMFGNRAATTVCYSSTSMVCILPPAEQNTTVFVSFKEHPFTKTNDLPTFFSYYEQSKQDLIPFTLQVVGLRSSSCAHYQSNQINNSTTSNQVSSNFLYYDNQQLSLEQTVELKIIQILSDNFYDPSVLAQTNMGGQNLLHFAAYLNMYNLVEFLAVRNPNLVNSQDRNGLTPLHFGCQNKSTEAIDCLIKLGGNITQMSSVGTAIDLVANFLNPIEFQYLKNQVHQGSRMFDIQKSNMVKWLPNLFVHAVIQYNQRNNLSVWPCAPIFPEHSATSAQESNVLF